MTLQSAVTDPAQSAVDRVERVCVNVHGCLPYQNGRLTFVRGQGAYLMTSDGRSCVDLVNAFGSVLLGHADPAIVEAVSAAVTDGLPAAAHDIAGEVAERIIADTAHGSTVAFFKTGTDAVRAATLAVRAVRRRRLLVSAGFHGWDEPWTPAAREPFTINEAGVFDCFYLPEALEPFLDSHAGDVAAAVISPDYLHLHPARLRRLIQACRDRGVPVIADDVKYGYRFGAGSSLRQVGIEADVYVYAKGLANGWPIACVAGPPELLAPMRLWCSTLTYDVPSLAAARATLEQLAARGAQARIAEQGAAFLAAARDRIRTSRLPIEPIGDGHGFQFVLAPELDDAFFAYAAEHGLLLSPGDNQFPSLAFAGGAIDDALRALSATLDDLSARFPQLRSAPLTQRARWLAAWSQMDGFADGDDAVDADTRRAFIAEQLASGEEPV